MTTKLNGLHLVHLTDGKELIVNYVDGIAFPGNIDMIDPPDFKQPMYIVDTHIVAVEPLSAARVEYLREMSVRRLRTNDIQTIVQLKQAIAIGEREGVINLKSEQPVQPKNNLKVVQPNEPVVDDRGIAGPVEVQPSRIIDSGGDFNTYDGKFVTVPKPGIR